MRLVLLAGTRPEQRYVADRLSAAFGDDLRAILIAESPHGSLVERARSYGRRYTPAQLASRVAAKTYRSLTGRERRRRRTLAERLFPAGDPGAFARPDLVRRVPSHNGEAARSLLAELAPDVIAVYGTRVIRAPVIRLARRAMVNMHTGLSPRYRGSDTVFWPLHNEEPEWIGVTLHILDEGVDSGPVIRTARPVIDARDDEDTLFCKCVIRGAELYPDAIRDAWRGERALGPQALAEGREYRFVDRTVAAERRVARLLREGLLARFVARAR